MSAYERQLLAKYHRADLLREGREARLARAAGHASTERVAGASLSGPLGSFVASAVARLHRGAAGVARTGAVEASVSGHVMLRPAHPR
jgi:hypothetical protein